MQLKSNSNKGNKGCTTIGLKLSSMIPESLHSCTNDICVDISNISATAKHIFDTNTGFKDVPMNEKTTEIGQDRTDFMSDVDSFDQDNITPCLDSTPSPTLLYAEGLETNGIKDAPITKMTTKNGLKLTTFMIDDDPTSHEDIILLSASHFDNGWSPILLIAACTEDIDIEDVPMTEKTTRKGQKQTTFLLENAPNDSNKITMSLILISTLFPCLLCPRPHVVSTPTSRMLP